MDQQKSKQESPNKNRSKERLIVAFVLISTLLVITDVGRNLTDEIRTTSERKTLSTELTRPQPKIQSTLSEEEMKNWTERLKNRSDT